MGRQSHTCNNRGLLRDEESIGWPDSNRTVARAIVSSLMHHRARQIGTAAIFSHNSPGYDSLHGGNEGSQRARIRTTGPLSSLIATVSTTTSNWR